jgi:hypothetical protein
VRHAALALEDPDPLELDLLRTEAVEQPASLSEEDRDDVELELIEDAGGTPMGGATAGNATGSKRGFARVE